MRLTLVASLALCGFFCTGCETLNKTARFPGKKPVVPEQLANDQKRREATEQEVAKSEQPKVADSAVQQTNFTPTATASSTEMDPILLRAKQAEQAQQSQVAKSLYDQVLQKQPQNAEAHHRLGVLADQEGRYSEAQQHYQVALQQDPQNASLLSDIGYSYYSQDRLDDAEKYLQSALQVQPGNQYARNNLAHVYGRRAQQSGSTADYKLAEDNFMLALGPQGAEQQMKNLFPQGAPAQGKRGIPNPFKKSDKLTARSGSTLQAPKPKTEDGNERLLRQMAEMRLQMEQSGQLPPKRPEGDSAGNNAMLNGRRNPQGAVPFDQMNDALTGIDNEAEMQRLQVLRDSYPDKSRGLTQATPASWNQGGIEQVGGMNDLRGTAVPPMDRFANGADNHPLWKDGPAPRNAGGDTYGQPDGSNYQSNGRMSNGGGYGQGYAAGAPGNRNGNYAGGTGDQYQEGRGPGSDSFAQNQGQTVRPAAAGAPPSWPDAQGSPTQFDARGNLWDGQSIINDTQLGRDSNANRQNDPTYRTGGGQAFGPQRPLAGNRTNSNGWNEGRQAAAQLGLDAGMGEMFPGGEADMHGGPQAGYPQAGYPQSGYPQGSPSNGPSAGARGTADPSLAPNQTGPRGMPAGGNGMMSPADYYYSLPSYQNNGYSQGVNPTLGDNYGQQGGDVSAPWNQSSTTQRGGVGCADVQYGNDFGGTQGRFAPSRQSASPVPQNFGAPPMYYGR